jgi:hypothetical protein
MLAFPDFSKPFHVYTDASNYQLGAVIIQEGKPLAFYSRKLNNAQKNYTTGEQELLSIVETLKEFRNILLGQKIIIHADHMNIVYGKLSNDRIVRWRLLLEEYGPEYVHIKGKENVVADALSRMDLDDGSENEEKAAIMSCYCLTTFEMDWSKGDLQSGSKEYNELFSLADKEFEAFPMRPALIAREQQKDKTLMKNVGLQEKAYGTRILEGATLHTYEGKIYIPQSLRERIVAWYHVYLQHPGMTRLEAHLRQHYYWPRLRETVQAYTKTCKPCQLGKKTGQKNYGSFL